MSELALYTTPIEDGMRVRHGARARFTVRTGGGQVLEDDLTPAETIGGALIRAGIMYNRLSMSGGVSWWNPATGRPIRRPKITVLVRPDDVLTGDELCTCSDCSVTTEAEA